MDVTTFPVQSCPLCLEPKCQPHHQDKSRTYLKCSACELIFVPTELHISSEQEKQHYNLHQNSPLDSGYRKFLSQLSEPLIKILQPNSYGLDFGCGPGPTLSVMLEEKGHHVDLFDENYFKNEQIWQNQYDFVTATEVIEHLRNPRETLMRISTLLKPRGLFAVMTQTTDTITDFVQWHYMRDPTHICFFHSETFKMIAKVLSAEITYTNRNVVIFKRST